MGLGVGLCIPSHAGVRVRMALHTPAITSRLDEAILSPIIPLRMHVCCVHTQDSLGEATDLPVLKLFEFLVASICLFMIEVRALSASS